MNIQVQKLGFHSFIEGVGEHILGLKESQPMSLNLTVILRKQNNILAKIPT